MKTNNIEYVDLEELTFDEVIKHIDFDNLQLVTEGHDGEGKFTIDSHKITEDSFNASLMYLIIFEKFTITEDILVIKNIPKTHIDKMKEVLISVCKKL